MQVGLLGEFRQSAHVCESYSSTHCDANCSADSKSNCIANSQSYGSTHHGTDACAHATSVR